MWKESFSISFRHLKSLLGFWACCTDITSSGIGACQCFYCEKANELVRMSLHHYIPKNTVAARTSPVRIFFCEVVIARLDCKRSQQAPTYPLFTTFLPFSLLSPSLMLLDWKFLAVTTCSNKKKEVPDAVTGPQGKASVTSLWALMKMELTDEEATDIFNLSCSHSF